MVSRVRCPIGARVTKARNEVVRDQKDPSKKSVKVGPVLKVENSYMETVTGRGEQDPQTGEVRIKDAQVKVDRCPETAKFVGKAGETFLLDCPKHGRVSCSAQIWEQVFSKEKVGA